MKNNLFYFIALLVIVGCTMRPTSKCKLKITDTSGIKKHYQNQYKKRLITKSERDELINSLDRLRELQIYQFINCKRN